MPRQAILSKPFAEYLSDHYPVFVYGTLKTGERNASFLSQAAARFPAMAQGELYETGSYPIARLAKRCLHPKRWPSTRQVRDIEAVLKLNTASRRDAPAPDLPFIEGEIAFIPRDDTRTLTGLDFLEDFVPRRRENLFQRVCAAVLCAEDDRPLWTWSYTAPAGSPLVDPARRIESGEWRGASG